MKLVSTLLALVLISFSTASFAQTSTQPGCLQTQYYLKILELYELTHPTEVPGLKTELQFIKFQACSGAYANNDTIRYRNGTRATSYAGDIDATWYWPNGTRITSYALQPDASVYYPNGTRMTSYFLKTDATYYYGNGNRITSYAGQPQATFYLIGGQSARSPGFTQNGQLDLLSMIDYVIGINGGWSNPPPPTSCSISQVKAGIQQAKSFIQSGQGQQAINLLTQVESCL